MNDQDVVQDAVNVESLPLAQEKPVGECLRQAREARQLSVAEIAQVLKLGVRQVDALESGQWDGLPGATFIRGFVRNYARQVGLDPLPLMQQLDQSLAKPVSNLEVPETRPAMVYSAGFGSSRKNKQMVFGGLAVVIVAGLLYFLAPNDLSALRDSTQAMLDRIGKAEKTAAQAAEPVETKVSDPVFPPGTTPQQVMNPQVLAPAAEPAVNAQPPVVATPVAAEKPPAAAPLALSPPPTAVAGSKPQLRFLATKEAWVEVKDRDGKVVFSQRLAAGSEQLVSGQGPLSLVVGYAPGVELFWHGEKVDLTPHARGDVARLVLE